MPLSRYGTDSSIDASWYGTVRTEMASTVRYKKRKRQYSVHNPQPKRRGTNFVDDLNPPPRDCKKRLLLNSNTCTKHNLHSLLFVSTRHTYRAVESDHLLHYSIIQLRDAFPVQPKETHALSTFRYRWLTYIHSYGTEGNECLRYGTVW